MLGTRALDRVRGRNYALLVAGVVVLGGCATSIGPPTVARDRFDYISTISSSWKQQLLLNLLKVRYFDAPVFMDVASVISSYAQEAGVEAAGQIAPVGRAGDTFGALGFSGRYADRPTITYSPLSGEKFAKNLMTPLPIPGVLLLMQGGYPSDVVMRLCVSTINGLENSFGGVGSPRSGSSGFRDLLVALRETQNIGGLGMRIKSAQERQAVVMFVPPANDDAAMAAIGKMRRLLRLDPSVGEYEVVYGSHARNDREIAMLTRSVMEVLIEFASYIDVPEADYKEGRVYRPQRSEEQERLFPPMLTVSNGLAPPEDAYVAARYRGRWFWIDDRDQQSKAMFTSVLFLLSLTETGQAQAAPVVTIPAR